ncbi:hypothetical protein T310_7518 [Rasamsonia emersonii CBS 393.64]|uniref:Uncharacterized protein n=1 Tax=Rasamsonia emersonii (strain ATCC 16479 / CBS 393.64 / IMI 116815) TaxID=1408163 RepID=A0A0F4YJW9_RASE3|nr:hypothetical protein T310_7518 [Rasamsonia emersonii CBS 393.64]KKA18524.1 hypothetical protein T310_7518 [Rasamsonia emersonii CBS 393.64]
MSVSIVRRSSKILQSGWHVGGLGRQNPLRVDAAAHRGDCGQAAIASSTTLLRLHHSLPDIDLITPPGRSIFNMSAQNSAGIQTLLDAEREAQKIVQQDRTKRVKDARTEAQKEIEEYRRQKEEEFRKFEAEHTSGNKKAEEEANREAELRLQEIKEAGKKHGDKVIQYTASSIVHRCGHGGIFSGHCNAWCMSYKSSQLKLIPAILAERGATCLMASPTAEPPYLHIIVRQPGRYNMRCDVRTLGCSSILIDVRPYRRQLCVSCRRRSFSSRPAERSSQRHGSVHDPRFRDLGKLIEDKYAFIRTNYETPTHTIVLAHGLLGFDELRIAGSFLPAIQYWYGIKDALSMKGIKVITATVPPYGSIEERAAELARYIRAGAKGKDVNIIA